MAVMDSDERVKRLQVRVEALSAKRKAIEADAERLRHLPSETVFTKDQTNKQWWAEQAKAVKK
jgi:hypothetical protein